LWPTSARTSGFFADLNELVRLGDGSCLLFSTRHKEIARYASSDHVVFEAREPRGQEAMEMLRKHVDMDKAALTDLKNTGDENLGYVLGRCAGLPLALAVAGRSIATSLRTANQTPAGALKAYARKLESTHVRLIDKGVDLGTVQYPGLRPVIEASVSAANDSFSAANDSFSTIGEFSIVDMHSALSVMQKQQWVPVTMLGRLRCLQDEDEATEVSTCISEFSIVNKACREGDGVVGITLHDLVYDVCVARVARNGGAAVWHRLLDAYAADLKTVPEILHREDEAADVCVPWWSDELADDGYVHVNLARHIVFLRRGRRGKFEGAAVRLSMDRATARSQWHSTAQKRFCANALGY
jgi:hypothetical protein